MKIKKKLSPGFGNYSDVNIANSLRRLKHTFISKKISKSKSGANIYSPAVNFNLKPPPNNHPTGSGMYISPGGAVMPLPMRLPKQGRTNTYTPRTFETLSYTNAFNTKLRKEEWL